MVAKKSKSKLDRDLDRLEAEIQRYKAGIVHSGKKVRHPKNVSRDVVSAARIEKVVEEDVKLLRKPFWGGKDLSSKNLGSIGFYFFSSLVCVGILAFLFGSLQSFIFYFVLGLILWWWSHKFHVTGAGVMTSFFSLGFVVVPLFVSYWFFDDLLSILVCIIYALSFIISGVLYFYHSQRGLEGEIHKSFPRTFLVMLYSHIMAFTAASVVAYLLPEVLLSDSFVSIIFILLVWLMPSLLVYFFLTKFLYLRFFDRVHLRRDLRKGLAHGVIYTVVFMFIIIFAYFLTAMQFVIDEHAGYEETFQTVLSDLGSVKSDMSSAASGYGGGGILDFKVTKDVIALSEQRAREASALKDEISREDISFSDYVSDNYFTIISRDRLALASMSVFASEVHELDDDLLREYARMNRFKEAGVFDDGTVSLEAHGAALERYVKDAYIPYSDPLEIDLLQARISSSLNSYSGLLGDGKLIDFNVDYYLPDAALLKPGDSRFSKRFYDVVHHTVLFRDLMLFMFNMVSFNVKETLDPYVVHELLYASGDESLASSVLRYRVVKSNIDATFSLAG